MFWGAAGLRSAQPLSSGWTLTPASVKRSRAPALGSFGSGRRLIASRVEDGGEGQVEQATGPGPLPAKKPRGWSWDRRSTPLGCDEARGTICCESSQAPKSVGLHGRLAGGRGEAGRGLEDGGTTWEQSWCHGKGLLLRRGQMPFGTGARRRRWQGKAQERRNLTRARARSHARACALAVWVSLQT